MEIFSHPVIAVILLLGILVIVHELGHFVVGRLCGIAVETFSIGFGAPIVRFTRGETEYRISWLPLGGFVKFYGSLRTEEVPAELRGREFYSAALWKRSLTIAAGPLANFLLAVVALGAMGFHGIPQPPAVIGEIMRSSPAEKAGFKYGDLVVAIDGHPVANWRELQKFIVAAPSKSLNFRLVRDGRDIELQVVPDTVPDEDKILRKSRGQIGISPGHVTSVLTVPEASSLAAVAGLRTGDRVVTIETNTGRHEVKYWRQFLELLRVAREAKVQIVTVEVQTEVHDTKESLGPGRKVELNLSQVPEGVSGTELASFLGIRDSQLTIFEAKGPEAAPLKRGDLITAWNGQPLVDAFQLRDASVANQKEAIVLKVQRDGKALDIPVNLKPVVIQKAEGKAYYYMLPVSFWGQMEQPEPVIERYPSPIGALAYGIRETTEQSKMIFFAVLGLITGDMPLEALGGPISIAKVAADSVRLGWQTFFGALSLISINLGLLNLFPIPVLDGGQLVLIAAEGIKRRPLTNSAIENYQKIGFVMVMALLVIATYNDLSRFWTSMIEGVMGLLP